MKSNNKQRLFEIMRKVDSSFNNEGVNFNMLYNPNDYKRKADEIKAVIDKLYSDEEYDDIDTLYRLLVRRTKPSTQELQEVFDKLGHDENIEEAQEMLQERLETFASDIHREISKIPGITRLGFWSLADGFVGLYRYEKDGNAYEIEIRPIQLGKHKELWGNLVKKRNDRNEQ